MRWAFLPDPKELLTRAREIATDVEPWAETVVCSVDDYVAAGLRCPSTKLPIPKSTIGPWWPSTNPFTPERIKEEVAHVRANTHIVELRPDQYVPRGRIATP